MPKQVLKLWDVIRQSWPVLAGILSAIFLAGVAWSEINGKHEQAMQEIADTKARVVVLENKHEAVVRVEEGVRHLVKTVDEIKNDIKTLRKP